MTGATSPYVMPSVKQAVHTVNIMKAFELLKADRLEQRAIFATSSGLRRLMLHGRSQSISYKRFQHP